MTSNKKANILDVATTLFSEHGYHAVGVDTIVAESKVAKMTFYNYFPSKDALIAEVLEARDKSLRESMLLFISGRRTPLSKLKGIFEWYENWFNSPSFHGCMFIKVVDEFPDDSTTKREIAKKYKSWLIGLISSLLLAINEKNSEALSSLIVFILDGLTVNCQLIGKPASEQVSTAWQQVRALIVD